MKAMVKDNKLYLELDLQEPTISSSGKNLVVASSRGNQTTDALVDGKQVIVGVNAYVRR
jgi:hypothetical protein